MSVRIVSTAKSTLNEMVKALKDDGYPIFAVDTHESQIELTACLNQNTGLWVIASQDEFDQACGNGINTATIYQEKKALTSHT